MSKYKRYFLDPVKVRNLRLLWRLYLARLLGFPLLLMATLFALISVYHPVYAVSKTWDGGCGANTNWSCANNWSDDVVPAAGDIVTFNATSTNNSTVDSLFNATETITTININSGYTGTITLGTTLHVSTFAQHAGTFTAANQTLDINGNLTLDAGTFTASSGLTSFAGAITISGSPTFNANGGTVTFDGAGSGVLSCNNVTFNLVTFTHTTATKTVNSNCSLPLGANPTIIGPVSISGTLTGSGTITSSATYTRNTGSAVTGFTGIVANSTYTINGATVDQSAYTTADYNGAFQLTAGTFKAPAGTMTAAGTFTLSAGTTFNANGGTLTFDGSTATLSCNNAAFNLVVFNNTGTKTVGSDCNLPLGTNPSTGAGLTLNGTVSGSGTLTVAASGMIINATGALSGFTGLVDNSTLIINGAATNFGNYTTLDLNTAFTLNSGAVFTAPVGIMTVAGNFTLSSGTTFNANSGTVTFDGAGNGTLACNNTTFHLVTFAHTAAVKTVGSDCNLPLGSNPDFSNAGSITLNGTLSGSGVLTLSRASGFTITFNSGSSLVGFTGFVARNLIINGATMDFSAYSPVTLDSNFILSAGAIYTAPTGTMSVGGTFTLSSGTTFNANGGTVTFTGINGTLSCNNAIFSLVTFAHTGTKTVSSDCSFPLGNNPTIGPGPASGIILNGTLSGSGILTIGGSGNTNPFTLNSTGILSGFNGLVFNGGFTQDDGVKDYSNYTTLDFNQNFTLRNNATFIAPLGNATFAGDFTLNSGTTFSANGGTVTFDGNSPAILSCNNTIFNKVNISQSGSANLTINSGCSLPLGSNPTASTGSGGLFLYGTLTGSGTLIFTPKGLAMESTGVLSGFNGLVIGNNLTVDGATLDLTSYTVVDVNNNLTLQNGAVFTAPTGTMTVAGSFSNSATFNPNAGTVVLDGTDQTIIGSTTFHNLTKQVSSASTLTLPVGVTETIQGSLTLSGASGQILSLASASPGSQWQIDAQGGRSLSYLGVTDSKNMNGATLVACNSTDSGDNTGWSFNPSSCNPVVSSTTLSSSSARKKVPGAGSSSNSEASTGTTTEESTAPTESPKTVTVSPSVVPEIVAAGIPRGWISWIVAGLGGLLLCLMLIILASKRRRRTTAETTTIFPDNFN